LSLWEKPSFSREEFQLTQSFFLSDQNHSPPWPDSRSTIKSLDLFLAFLDFSSNVVELVEAICPSREIPTTRISGVKDCRKVFGPRSISQRRRNIGVKSRTPLNLVLGHDISLPKEMDIDN